MHSPIDSSYLMPVTPRPEAVMIRGKGSYLWDQDGKRYLDFIQGWAVNALGHSPPEVRAALNEQSGALIAASPALHTEPQLELSRRLCERSSMASVFFCNCGAEANEGAIKLARKWGRTHRDGAFEIITTHGGFHGRTLAAMAASGKPGWDAMFPPRLEGFVKVPYGDVAAVGAAITDRTAAVLVEPIQGEAGVVVPPPGYLTALRRLADEKNILLMLDEVQTGMARTGTLFAFEQEHVRPDVLTLGKGLGSGVPLAALLSSERAGTLGYGEQGGTFNGSALMTAVGLAVLETVGTPSFLERVQDAGTHLRNRLESLAPRARFTAVRGRGLLAAADLDGARADRVREACFERGLIVNAPRPSTLRFMPSLRVTVAEIDEMAALLEAAISTV